MGLLPRILIILLFIIFGGFFSLFESAFGAARKSALRSMAEGKGKKYHHLVEAAEDPRFYLAAARIWFAFLRIFIGVLAGFGIAGYHEIWLGAWNRFAPYSDTLAAAAIIAAVTIVAIVLGDVLPRLIALTAPEKIAAATLPLMHFFALICRPFFAASARATAGIRRIFHVDDAAGGMTEDELRIALAEGEKSGVVESQERTMVEGVFYLGDRPVGAFMTHRSEVQWLDANAPPPEILAQALEYRSQRCFPVADGTLDAIIGAVYLEDIILDQIAGPQKGIKAVMKKAQFVPETMSALKAFESFKRGEANFLFVMDEYGGFAGIISIRDLFEEIVGELSATQTEEDPIIQSEDGTWLADGSLNIDDAAKILDLPDLSAEFQQDYHTLAGFVLSLAGEVPRTGMSFLYHGRRFTVVDMDGHRIDKVMIKLEKLTV
jgi:putative hemolysin